MESPRERTMFGTPVPDEADSYYEGAFQAENSAPDDYFEDDEVVCDEESADGESYGDNTSDGYSNETGSGAFYKEGTADEPERRSFDADRVENSSRGYREPEEDSKTEDMFRNMGGENVRGTVENTNGGFPGSGSGRFSWGSFGIIVAAVMILVAVISLLTRAVIAAGPVILVILAVILILNTIRKK